MRFADSWVEIYFHKGRGQWAGEYYILATRNGDPLWSGVVFSMNRKKIPGLLRKAVAEKYSSKVKEVNRRLLNKEPPTAAEDYNARMSQEPW